MMTVIFLVIGFVVCLSLFQNWQDRAYTHNSGYYPPPPSPYYPPPMPYPPAYNYGQYGNYGDNNALPATIAFISLLLLGMWYYGNKTEPEPPRPQKATYKSRAEKLEEQTRFKQPETAPCPCACDCANQI